MVKALHSQTSLTQEGQGWAGGLGQHPGVGSARGRDPKAAPARASKAQRTQMASPASARAPGTCVPLLDQVVRSWGGKGRGFRMDTRSSWALSFEQTPQSCFVLPCPVPPHLHLPLPAVVVYFLSPGSAWPPGRAQIPATAG